MTGKPYAVILETGEVLRDFNDPAIAIAFSDQLWEIGKRKNRCIDTRDGEVLTEYK